MALGAKGKSPVRPACLWSYFLRYPPPNKSDGTHGQHPSGRAHRASTVWPFTKIYCRQVILAGSKRGRKNSTAFNKSAIRRVRTRENVYRCVSLAGPSPFFYGAQTVHRHFVMARWHGICEFHSGGCGAIKCTRGRALQPVVESERPFKAAGYCANIA